MRGLILATLLFAGCAQTPVATVEPVCGSMRTVWISREDRLTPLTAQQIEANNLAREKLCGRSRPPATPKTSGAPTS